MSESVVCHVCLCLSVLMCTCTLAQFTVCGDHCKKLERKKNRTFGCLDDDGDGYNDEDDEEEDYDDVDCCCYFTFTVENSTVWRVGHVREVTRQIQLGEWKD